MTYSILKKDDNNFNIIFSENFKECFSVKKYKNDKNIYYYFPVYGEDSYQIILEYMAQILDIKYYCSVYDEDAPMEDEYYCRFTKNLIVKFDSSTGLISVYINDDNVNENRYDQIVINVASKLYSSKKELRR